MFRTNKYALGEIVRYKARLITKGYFQVAKVDFNETFVLVAKFITIICILALGVVMDSEIHQMDVKLSLFYFILEVEIYMDQPEDLIQEGKKNLVCKLKKILYGFKQIPRAWYHRIDSFFINKGFCMS